MGSAVTFLMGNPIRLIGNRAVFEMGIRVPIEIFLVSLIGADDRSCAPAFRGGNFRSRGAGREVLPIRSRESIVRMERRTGRSIAGRPRAGDRSRGEEDRVPAGRSDFFTTRERDPFKGLSFEPRSRGRSSEGFARGPFARTGRSGRADDFRIGRIVDDAFFGPLRGGVGIR